MPTLLLHFSSKMVSKSLSIDATMDKTEQPTEPLFAFGEAPRDAGGDPTDDFCGDKNEDPSEWKWRSSHGKALRSHLMALTKSFWSRSKRCRKKSSRELSKLLHLRESVMLRTG
jgi:hypothetical protein